MRIRRVTLMMGWPSPSPPLLLLLLTVRRQISSCSEKQLPKKLQSNGFISSGAKIGPMAHGLNFQFDSIGRAIAHMERRYWLGIS